jgi:hypothetical protein
METSSDSLPLGQCLSWLLLAGFSPLKEVFPAISPLSPTTGCGNVVDRLETNGIYSKLRGRYIKYY